MLHCPCRRWWSHVGCGVGVVSRRGSGRRDAENALTVDGDRRAGERNARGRNRGQRPATY